MNARIVGLLWLMSVTLVAWGQMADANVAAGRAFLAQHDWTNAHLKFQAAVNAAPAHETANLLYGVTRLLRWPNQATPDTFLTRLGFSAAGRSVEDWSSKPPRDAEKIPVAPAGVRASEFTAVWRTNFLLEVIGSEANLAKVVSPGFLLALTAEETRSDAVTLDLGDVLMLRALLHTAEYFSYTLASWNVDVQLTVLRALYTNDHFNLGQLLDGYASLFTYTTTNDLAAAKQAFTNAVGLYLQASSFIRGRPPGTSRLFSWDPDMADAEYKFRLTLTDLRDSLNGALVSRIETNLTFRLASHFDGTHPLRLFLPSFTNDLFIEGTLPDPTFGGLVLGGPDRSEVESGLASLGLKELSPDAHYWRVVKGRLYQQTNSGLAALLPNNAYVAGFSIQPGAPDTVTNATATAPNNGPVLTLVRGEDFDGEEQWARGQAFSSQAALDAAFGDGSYTLTLRSLENGERGTTFPLTGSTYPAAAPHLRNFEAAQHVNPDRDFTLSWEAFAGGTTNDFIQLRLFEAQSGREVFETPASMDEGGLNGTVVGTTLPAGTLASGSLYRAELLFLKSAFADRPAPTARRRAGYYALTRFSVATVTLDLFGVIKGQMLLQTNALAPALLPTNAFFFGAPVLTASGSSMWEATVRLPSGVTRTGHYYPFSSGGLFDTAWDWFWMDEFNSLTVLEAAYPSGAYAISLFPGSESSSRGTVSNGATLNLAGSYPNAPQLNNFVAAQAIDGDLDFTLSWGAFTGGTAADFIQLSLYDSSGRSVLQTPTYGRPGALTGTAVSYRLPAATLARGTYFGSVLFGKAVAIDTNSCPGAIALAGLTTITYFPLKATRGQPAADVVPVALSLADTRVTGQAVLKVSFSLTNRGERTATSWPNTFYLSAKSYLDAAAWPILLPNDSYGYGSPQSLAPGQRLTSTKLAQLPAVPVGNYYLLLAPGTDAADSDLAAPGGMEQSGGPSWADLPWRFLSGFLDPTRQMAQPLTVTALPDLVATRFAVGKLRLEGQAQVEIHASVRNQGAGTAYPPRYSPEEDSSYGWNGWSDSVYLSPSNRWSAAATFVTSFSHSSPLAPGASYDLDTTCSLPGVASGSYYLIFRADSSPYQYYAGPTTASGWLYESDEGNNELVVPITITTLPDLAPVALQPSQPVICPGSSVTITWAGINQGLATLASYGWYDKVYLSPTNVYDGSATNLTTSYHANGGWNGSAWTYELPPGGFYTNAWSGVLPAWPAGTYYLLVRLDRDYSDVGNESEDSSTGSVFEANEANNLLVVPVVLAAGPDLVPSALSCSDTLVAGQSTVTFGWQVENRGGCAPDNSWVDSLYLSPTNGLDGRALLIGNATWYEWLSPGGSYSNSLTAKLPGVAPGNYFLVLQTDGEAGAGTIPESDETNNLRILPVTITAVPDLTPLAFRASSPTNFSGGLLTATWTVLNQGVAAAQPGWLDRFFLSPRSSLDADALFVGAVSQETILPAGQSYTQTSEFTLPQVPAGKYFLIVQTDGGASSSLLAGSYDVFEANENNNTRTVPLLIQGPDLVVTALTTPSLVVTAQTEFSLTRTVLNQGGAPASWYNDRLYVSSKPTLDESAWQISSWVRGGWFLESGMSNVETGTFWVPSMLGPVYLIVQADANNDCLESSETNNTRALALTVLAGAPFDLPDLAPTSLLVSNSSVCGQSTLQVSWIVTNQGSEYASGCWGDRFFLSTKTTLDDEALWLAEEYDCHPLAPGSDWRRSASLTLPGLPAGQYYLYLQVDAATWSSTPEFYPNAVYESNEENNVMRVPLTITGLMDLKALALTAPASTCGQSFLEVSWTVTNAAPCVPWANPLSWHDTVYLSPTNVLNERAIWLGQIGLSIPDPAPPGYTLTNWVQLPDVAPGSYYLLVSVDDTADTSAAWGALYESNETNNLLARAIVLTGADLQPIGLQAFPTNCAGDSVSVVWSVTNRGSCGQPSEMIHWWDRFYLSPTNVLDYRAWPLDSFWLGASELGSRNLNYSRTNSLTLPLIPPGNYYLLVRVNDEAASSEANPSVTSGETSEFRLLESNSQNNFFAMPMTLLGPDLKPISLSLLSTSVCGQAACEVFWTVTNLGACLPQTAWFDRLYVSTKQVLDNTALPIAYVALDPAQAPPGTFQDSRYSWSSSPALPPLAPGNYFLLLQTDSGWGEAAVGPKFDAVMELVETNNVLATPFRVTGVPDLAPTEVLARRSERCAQPYPESPHATYLQVDQWWTNRCPGAAFLSVTFDLNTYVYTWDSASLEVMDGQLHPVSESPFYNNSLGGRTLVIQGDTVVIHYASLYGYSWGLRVTDITGTGLEAQTNLVLAAEASLELIWGVTNASTCAASALWQDQLFLSRDAVLDASDLFLTSVRVTNGVGSWDRYQQNGSLWIPGSLLGEAYLLVQVDAANQLLEQSENNNTRAFPVKVTAPDLTPTDLALLSGPAVAGTEVQVGWTVRNQGEATAQAWWSDRLYLSTNRVLDATALELGTFEVSSDLPAGANATFTNWVVLPELAPGAYFLILSADDERNVFELQETNNQRSVSLTLTGTAPSIYAQPEPRFALAGASVALSVGAEHAVWYQWRRNGTNLPGATSATLSLPNVQPAQAGLYSVVVSNWTGAAISSNALLTVLGNSWGPENGVIVLRDSFPVPSGVTLTLRAGTILKFHAGASLDIRGTLRVLGTPQEPVVLTSIRDDSVGGDSDQDGATNAPSAGDWVGVVVSAPGAGGEIEGLHIRHAERALRLASSYTQVAVSRSRLQTNYYALFAGEPWTQATVENCLLEGNSVGLSAADNTALTLRNDTVVGNDRAGEFGWAVLTVDNTIVAFNGDGFNALSWRASPTALLRNSLFHSPVGSVVSWVGSTAFYDQDQNLTDDPQFAGTAASPYELSEASPAVDSGRGHLAPATDLLGRPRHDDLGRPNTGRGYPAFVDRGAFERQLDTAAADLAVTSVAAPVPAILRPGDTFTVQWVEANVGTQPVEGATWEDYLCLSRTPYFTGEEILLGWHTNSLTLQPGQSLTNSASFAVPGGLGGLWYVLVQANAQHVLAEPSWANNSEASAGTLAVDLPVVALNTPLTHSLPYGEWVYFRFEAPVCRSFVVTLTSPSSWASAGLFVRQGLPPTFEEYEAFSAEPGTANQQVRVLSPQTGTYYVGVYGYYYYYGGPPQFTLSVTVPQLAVRSVSPNRITQGDRATLKLAGDDFDPGTQVRLLGAAGSPLQAQALCQDPATLFATFDFSSSSPAPGLYSLWVSNSFGAVVTLPSAVTIEAAALPEFRAWLTMPGLTRPGRIMDLQVNYANPGRVSVASPLLTLRADAADYEWQLPGSGVWLPCQAVQLLALSPDGPAAVLRPGQVCSLPLRLRVPFRTGTVQVSLTSLGATATDGSAQSLDWGQIESAVRPSDMSGAAWASLRANLQTRFGSTWGGYVGALRATVLQAATAGVRVYDASRLLRVLADQAQGLPFHWVSGRVVVDATGAPLPETALSLSNSNALAEIVQTAADGAYLFTRASTGTNTLAVAGYTIVTGAVVNVTADQRDHGVRVAWGGEAQGTNYLDYLVACPNLPALPGIFQDQGRTPIRTSLDPEDKFGPSGYDAPGTPDESLKRFLTDGSLVNYTIQVWNSPNAGAPAQIVEVYDDLDTNVFDIGSFQFTRLRIFDVPAWDWSLAGQSVALRTNLEAMNLDVKVSASITNNRIYWRFDSLRPGSNDPADPELGILPPSTGNQNLWLDFQVRLKPGLASGTALQNQAFGRFEATGVWGAAPVSAPWLNTVDAAAPVSAVTQPAGTVYDTNFLVQWNGHDETNGSGIQGYDIYVRDNTGPWTLWLDNTNLTSATFTGQKEHTYAFYSLARDGVGHLEAKAAPDVIVTVSGSLFLTNTLYPGYNLIALPFVGTGYTNAENLIKALPSGAGIWKWDAVSQGWSGHRPGGPNNFLVGAGEAFMVNVTNAGSLTVQGTWSTGSRTLKRGYNLICLPKAYETLQTAEALVVSIAHCTGLWKWDGAVQGWSGHRKDGPNNFAVQLGGAYLVYLSEDADW